MNLLARSLRLSRCLDQIYLIDSIRSKEKLGCILKIREPSRLACSAYDWRLRSVFYLQAATSELAVY